MKRMLAVIFSYLLVGLLSKRFGPRQHAAVAVLGTAMTALYLVFSNRFM